MSDFIIHQAGCSQCKRVNCDLSATLSNACHKGAILLKNHLNEIAAPMIRAKQRAARLANKDKFKTSKRKLAEVMRFVE